MCCLLWTLYNCWALKLSDPSLLLREIADSNVDSCDLYVVKSPKDLYGCKVDVGEYVLPDIVKNAFTRIEGTEPGNVDGFACVSVLLFPS